MESQPRGAGVAAKWGLVAAFLVALAVTFARNPDLYLLPSLIGDDTNYFNWYYGNLGGAVWPKLAGYAVLLPQAATWAIVNGADIRWVPVLMSGVALLFAAGAFALVAAPAFAAVLPDWRHRLALAALFAAVPAGDFLLASNIVYTNWHALLIYLLLLLLPDPRGWGGALGRGAVMAAMLLSNPPAAVALPVHLWRLVPAVRERRWPAIVLHLGLVLAIAAYLLLGVAGGPRSARTLAFLTSPEVLTLPGRVAVYILDRCVFEAVAGFEARLWLLDRGLSALPPLAGGLLLGGLLALGARRRLFEATDLVLAYLVVAVTVMGFLGDPYLPEVIRSERAARYCYPQKFLVLLFMARLLARAGLWRGRRLAAALGAVALLLLAENAAALPRYRGDLNTPRVKAIDPIDWPVVDLSVEGRRLRTFLGQVRAAEKTLAAGERREMALDRGVLSLRLPVGRR